MKVTALQMPKMLKSLLANDIVPMIHGSPGIGKSEIVKQLADEAGLKIIDLRLAQCDPTDLLGFPSLQGKKAGYLPMETFPLDTDEVPQGYNGWLLFLDELTSASIAVQAAAYRLILDRQVGQHNIHPDCYIVGAGNLATDKAIVNRMSTALQSRMAHLELQLDHDSWYEWAEDKGIDHRIISYLRFKPDALYSFNPNHNDHTYSSPRTWEFTNRLIGETPITSDSIPLIASVINEGQARQFKGYTDIYKSLPTKEAILKDPKGIEISLEPSVLFAVSGFIKTFITAKNFDTCMDYIDRFPPEFQIIALKNVFKKNPKLAKTKRGQQWQMEFAREFLMGE